MDCILRNDFHIAVPTAFHVDEELNVKSTIEHIVNLQNKGIDSVLVCGSTGEQHSLTLSEKLELVEAIENDKRFRDDFEIIFGVSSIRQKDALALAIKTNASKKISGILLGFPPYILPSQEEIVVYVNTIAHAFDRSILLYNNPKRTGFDISIPSLIEVMKNKNIIGLKVAGDTARIPLIQSSINRPISIYAGGEVALKDKIKHGCNRLSSIAGNIYPIETRQWFRSLLANTEQPINPGFNIENEINKVFSTSTLPYLKNEISHREQLDMGVSRSPLGNL